MSSWNDPWDKPLWQRNAEDNMSLRSEIEKNYDAANNPLQTTTDFNMGNEDSFGENLSGLSNMGENDNFLLPQTDDFSRIWSQTLPANHNQRNDLKDFSEPVQEQNSGFASYEQNSNPMAFASQRPANTAENSQEETHLFKDKAPDFSYLRNIPLYRGLTAMPGQAHLKNLDTTLIKNREIVDTPYSDNVLENDCIQSERFEPFAHQIRQNEGENQGIIHADPKTHQIDQPTTYGITQDTLNNYRIKYPDIARTYPKNVKDLTEEQANNLICQYYKESRAEGINEPNLAFAHADSFFNGYDKSVNAWEKALNAVNDSKLGIDGVAGSKLINAFNRIDEKDKQKLYEEFLKHRLKTVEPKYKNGITNRIRRYR